MQAAKQAIKNVKDKVTKPERTPEEKQRMREQFLMAVNSYNIGEVSDDKLTKINNYVVQGDGIYLIVNNAIGQFITKIHEKEFPGLPKQFGGNRIKLNFPKIPSSIYYQIKNFFTDISEEMGEAEAFCQVYYNKEDKQYEVIVPKQVVSKASVQYDAASNLDNVNPKKYTLVFEIHSHNTMGAFWSGTDNADEKDTRFYGVLGNLDQEEIGEKYRYMIQGNEVAINKEHIFDFTEDLSVDKEELQLIIDNTENLTIDDIEQFIYGDREENIEYPKDWLENISKHSYNRPVNPAQNALAARSFRDREMDDWNNSFHSRGRQISMFDDDRFDPRHESDWQPSWQNEDDPAVLQEIWDNFDLTDLVHEQELETAFDAISTTIEPHQVGSLIEKLVDMGHHGEISTLVR